MSDTDNFAQIDENGVVTQVIVATKSFIDSGAVGDPTKWIQCSWSNKIRKRMPGPGYKYDSMRDAFITPAPYPSWVLDEETLEWTPPIPKPTTYSAVWDETNQQWISRSEFLKNL